MIKDPRSVDLVHIHSQESWEPSPVFLRYALATLLIGCLCYLSVIWRITPEQPVRFIGPAAGVAIALFAWYLLGTGRIRASIKLLAIGTWILVTFVAIVQGGVRTPAVIAYPVSIMLIGWLFSARAAVIVSSLTVMVIVGFVVGEENSWLPKQPPTPAVMYGVIQILLTVLAAFLVNFLIRSYKTRLQELLQAGLDLTQQTHELEFSKANLAITIEATRMVFWEYDIINDRLIYDDALLDCLGLNEAQSPHTLQSWLALIHPDDKDQFIKCFGDAVVPDGVPMDLDYRLAAKEGGWVWLHTRGTVVRRTAHGQAEMAGGASINITERKNIEISLQERERQNQFLFNQSPLPMWVIEESSLKFLTVNERALELYGYSLEEFKLMTLRDIRPTQDVPDLDRIVANVPPASFVGEFRHLKKNGDLIDVVITTSLTTYDQKVARITTIQDVTKEKTAELAIRQSEERFRSLTNLSSDWYWEQDAEFKFIRLDGDLELRTGITVADHYGLTRWDMPALNLTPADWDDHKAVLHAHLPFRDFEMRRPNQKNREHWVSVSGTPIFDEQTHFIGYRGVGKDITERKVAEAKLQRSEQLLRGAIDAVDEAFVLYGPDDRLVFCNEKYIKLYAALRDLIVPGASFEEIVRKGAERGQFPEAIGRVEDWVGERMTLHRAADTTLIQKLDDGRVLRILERKLPDGSTAGFRIDITDLVRATQAAQDANLAKSRFLATMSHEIRTPMNGILGMAQLLLMPNLNNSERHDYARTILTSGQTLLVLLNDILDLSKIEAGKFQLESVVFDPQSLLRDASALFAGAARTKNLKLEPQWLGPPGQRYKADVQRLRQMISNLLGNAIKFTPNGKIDIEAEEIERSTKDVLLRFSVTDTGIGIDADKLDLLYRPFSQTDNSTTRQFGGSGLGLSIVKNLSIAMGGTVGVRSEPGKGSRFWFQIRAALVDEALESRQALRTNSETPFTDKQIILGQVLVVEDNPVNCMVIDAMLSKLGTTQTFANDGQQALNAIISGVRPDLILMDIHMPVMDGYVATQRIRQWETENSKARLPIIALTADAFEEDHQHCLAVGMNDFLTKPIAIEPLRTALTQWLPATSINTLTQASLGKTLTELDRQQFTKLMSEITPLLEHNLFGALSKIKELKSLVDGTELEAGINEVNEILQTFRFDVALLRLRQVVAIPTQ